TGCRGADVGIHGLARSIVWLRVGRVPGAARMGVSVPERRQRNHACRTSRWLMSLVTALLQFVKKGALASTQAVAMPMHECIGMLTGLSCWTAIAACPERPGSTLERCRGGPDRS